MNNVKEMNEKRKALELIKRLRDASYNHTDYGNWDAVDTDTAISLVEEIFEVDETNA